MQLAMGVLALLFGASMLVSQLITGPLLGVILVANGCVLLYQVRILIQLDRLERTAVARKQGRRQVAYSPPGHGGRLVRA